MSALEMSKMGHIFMILGPSLLFAFEIITQPTLAEWTPGGTNGSGRMEECEPRNVQRLIACMKNNQVVNYVNYSCVDANQRKHCNEGERLVLAINGQCITTECKKNILTNGSLCADNELPFKDHCYDINDKKPCQDHPHHTLQADLFGNVGCNCSDGFFFFNGKCFPESSFKACGGSTDQQLIWNDNTSELECVNNSCGLNQMLWRDGTSDNFVCVDFYQDVPDCEDILKLEQSLRNTSQIICDSWGFEFNSVVSSCNGSEIDGSGRCKPIGIDPKNKFRFKDLMRNICSRISEDIMTKHC